MLSWFAVLAAFAAGADGGCDADGLRLRLADASVMGSLDESMIVIGTMVQT